MKTGRCQLGSDWRRQLTVIRHVRSPDTTFVNEWRYTGLPMRCLDKIMEVVRWLEGQGGSNSLEGKKARTSHELS